MIRLLPGQTLTLEVMNRIAAMQFDECSIESIACHATSIINDAYRCGYSGLNAMVIAGWSEKESKTKAFLFHSSNGFEINSVPEGVIYTTPDDFDRALVPEAPRDFVKNPDGFMMKIMRAQSISAATKHNNQHVGGNVLATRLDRFGVTQKVIGRIAFTQNTGVAA